jgi:hypothetical protein
VVLAVGEKGKVFLFELGIDGEMAGKLLLVAEGLRFTLTHISRIS